MTRLRWRLRRWWLRRRHTPPTAAISAVKLLHADERLHLLRYGPRSTRPVVRTLPGLAQPIPLPGSELVRVCPPAYLPLVLGKLPEVPR